MFDSLTVDYLITDYRIIDALGWFSKEGLIIILDLVSG